MGSYLNEPSAKVAKNKKNKPKGKEAVVIYSSRVSGKFSEVRCLLKMWRLSFLKWLGVARVAR